MKKRVKKSIVDDIDDDAWARFLEEMTETEKKLGFPFAAWNKNELKSPRAAKSKDGSRVTKEEIVNKKGQKQTVNAESGEEVRQNKEGDTKASKKQRKP